MSRLSKLCIAGLCLLCCACSGNQKLEQNQPVPANQSIPNDHWGKDEVVQIAVPVTDTTCFQDIYINIRNLNSYAYSNLYLFVNVSAPNGDKLTDTVEYRLADDYGKWLGKSTSRIWDHQLPFRAMVKFAQTGTYTFNIQQGMRNDELEGISDVGLSIVPSKSQQ